ncbi:heme/hemin ABC transporter substrate-binding protein [Dermabacteraceae bacterium P7074]
MQTLSLSRRTLLAATLLIPLTGCGDKAAPSSGVSGGAAGLSSANLLADPASYRGPSTAHLQQSGVRPITDSPQPKLPRVMVDSQGTRVEVTDVSRILPLDLYGSLSRIVFDLGLGANVVGRDVSSEFAEVKDRPLVTQNGHQLNAEAILQLNPSVILTDSSLGPWDVVLQMRDAGIPVVVMDSHRSISSTPELIRQVANALGLPDEGEKLASRTAKEIEKKIAEIKSAIPQGSKPLRMMFFYARGGSGTYYIFGKGSGADDLIKALGGVDIASEIGWDGMKPMTDEAFLQAKPDLLLMMTGGLESCGGVEGLLDRLPAIALTPAGQNNRIVDMDDTDILSFGPNTAQVLDALAVAIYAPIPKAS